MGKYAYKTTHSFTTITFPISGRDRLQYFLEGKLRSHRFSMRIFLLWPKPVVEIKIAMTSLLCKMAIFSLGFKTIALFSRQIFKIDDASVNASLIFFFFAEMICSFPRDSPMGGYQNNNEPFYGGRKSMVFERKKYHFP